MYWKTFIVSLITVTLLSGSLVQAQSAAPIKPLSLPLNQPPGPSTWLLGQPYGNTTGAFNNGRAWYSAGQGLHFGLDFSMACGTELVAMADGEVLFVDDLGFGSAPHNLLIRHNDIGVVVLYGHLLQRSALQPGQLVTRGQVVGLSGDPDSTCDSRPHLHLEIRSLDYRTLYNPVDYIDAPWHMLATIGSFGYPLFQQDMLNPRQWMSVDDQPEVVLGGRILNEYSSTRPLPRGQQPPANPPLDRPDIPLAENTAFNLRPFGFAGCCVLPHWHPTDSNRLYVVDGSPNQQASIFEWSIADAAPTQTVTTAPPPLTSPDGSHEIIFRDGGIFIRRLADGADWNVQTQGSAPAISTDNSRLLWEIRNNTVIPGQPAATTDFWVSDILGQNARQILSQVGGSAQWLDATRLLIAAPQPQSRITTLSVFDTTDDSSYDLGSWEWMRGLDVSPGGERLLFYVTRNPDPAINGLYTLPIQPGATAQKVDWFGGWRWRDSHSVYYIPFDPATGQQQLWYHDFMTGASRPIIDAGTQQFAVANGDWAVSADGRKIVFYNAIDRTMWLIEEIEG